MMRVLCLGGSYSGKYLARHFSDSVEVIFCSRNPERLRASGLQAWTPDNAHVRTLDTVDLVLDTVPAVLDDGARLPYDSTVARLLSQPAHPVYLHLSTTAVYPSAFTAARADELPTFDEHAAPDAQAPRALNRLRLESTVTAHYRDARILRCGGIYGPGRSVATRFRAGDFTRAQTGNRLVSRIHVHDLCRLILAAGRPDTVVRTPVVNAVDTYPSTNFETFSYIEELLGITLPGNWRTAAPTGRRIVSRYAQRLLGGTYCFPTFREGFLHCLRDP